MTRILGIDLGERRIGLALADGDGSPARPLQTIRRGRTPADDATVLAPIVVANQVVQQVEDLVNNMPQVFDVADRIHIQRLGKRAATITPQSHSMTDAVAIMTGAASA